MEVQLLISKTNIADQLKSKLDSLPDGHGYTKEEIAKLFNLVSPTTVEKWVRKHRELEKYRSYIPIHNGRNRTAIFTNLKYKQALLENGTATETY